MKTVTEILLEAARLVREGWTTGALARNHRGHPVPAPAPDATCFCVLGAIRRASHGHFDLFATATLQLNRSLPVGMRDQLLSVWNDAQDDAETVARALEHAASYSPNE